MKVKGIYDIIGLESCAPIEHDYPYKLRSMLKHRATYYEAEIDSVKFEEVQSILKTTEKASAKALKKLKSDITLKTRYNLLEHDDR